MISTARELVLNRWPRQLRIAASSFSECRVIDREMFASLHLVHVGVADYFMFSFFKVEQTMKTLLLNKLVNNLN